jgi:membrane protein implicated in regulation of membrane protease activity
MITCPWCGTHYAAFQSNCKNCGGPLPPPPAQAAAPAPEREADLPAPPPPPRPISDSYVWRLLAADGGAIVGGVFALLGAIFLIVGVPLTLAIITAFVGLPFAALGAVFGGVGGWLLVRRYEAAQKTVSVLRRGEAARGQITGVEENLSVRVNGRHPWTIKYQFQVGGRNYEGRVSTLNRPAPQLQPGQPAHVLYLPGAPELNALYPHP